MGYRALKAGLTNRWTGGREARFISFPQCLTRPRSTRALDPRRANRVNEMFGKPSQVADVSTLFEAKKRSSLVI
jgi:hypothetical protein